MALAEFIRFGDGLPDSCLQYLKSLPWPPESYTVRRLRPLARLRLITLRPFFVAMRFRKPCFLARLILLGWYVRFINHLQSVVMARPIAGWLGDA